MAFKINEYEDDKSKLNLWMAQREQDIAELRKKLVVTNTTANNAASSATAATGIVPDSITSPSASESGYIVDGVLFSEVTFTYTSPAVLGDFHGVFVVAKDYRASAELVKVYEHTFAGGPATAVSFPVTLQRTDESVTFFLVSKTSSGLAREDWGNAPSTSATLDGNASAPTVPTGLGATQQELGVQLSWSANSESNLAGYKLWRHTADVFGSATNISEIGTSRAGSPSYFDKTAGKGTTFFYWITAINTAAQESTESTSANSSGKEVGLDVLESFSQLVPNWNFSIVDSLGKPAGIRGIEGIASQDQIQFGGIGAQILGAPDADVGYGFPAIPIDDKQKYRLTIRHKSSTASATGLFLRFNELNTFLPAGKTHIGSTGGESVSTSRTSLTNFVSDGPMPGTTTVEDTFTYTPSTGVKFACFSMYNWTTFTGTYEVEFVQLDIIPKTAAEVSYTGGSTVESLEPDEAGANVTETRTSNDTTNVNAVAAATVQGGAAKADLGLDASGDVLRNIKTDKVVEASILASAVAVGKLKADAVARIFTTQTSRDDTVTGGDRALTNIQSTGKYVVAKYHQSAFRDKTTTNQIGSTTVPPNIGTWITVKSFTITKPEGTTQYKGNLSIERTGGTSATWTVKGRINVSGNLSGELSFANPTNSDSGVVTVTGLSSPEANITVNVQLWADDLVISNDVDINASFPQVTYVDQDETNFA